MGCIRNLSLNRYIIPHKLRGYVETGAGYGTSIYHALQFNQFNLIWSCEIIEQQAKDLAHFFRFDNRVAVIPGNSVDYLNQVVQKVSPEFPLLFLLDAHFGGWDIKAVDRADAEQNEDLRLPLFTELEILKNKRDGCKNDVIIIDDIFLFDDENVYEDSKRKVQSPEILPRVKRNSYKEIIAYFSATHNVEHLFTEQGWLIFAPKRK